MQVPDIWQALGTSQVAVITTIITFTVSIIFAQQGQRQKPILKKS